MEKKEIIKQIMETIQEVTGIDQNEIKAESEIVEELEMNSLEILSMISALEKRYKIRVSTKELREIFTVENLAEHILFLMKG